MQIETFSMQTTFVHKRYFDERNDSAIEADEPSKRRRVVASSAHQLFSDNIQPAIAAIIAEDAKQQLAQIVDADKQIHDCALSFPSLPGFYVTLEASISDDNHRLIAFQNYCMQHVGFELQRLLNKMIATTFQVAVSQSPERMEKILFPQAHIICPQTNAKAAIGTLLTDYINTFFSRIKSAFPAYLNYLGIEEMIIKPMTARILQNPSVWRLVPLVVIKGFQDAVKMEKKEERDRFASIFHGSCMPEVLKELSCVLELVQPYRSLAADEVLHTIYEANMKTVAQHAAADMEID